MRKLAPVLLVLCLGFALAQIPESIGSLYARDTSGSLNMRCTASVVRGVDVEVEAPLAILTAAHCVDDALRHDAVNEEWRSGIDFLVTFDEKTYYSVLIERVGFLNRGYDIAVLSFEENAPTIIPIEFGEWSDVRPGTEVVNWANPAGLGLQRFEGYITMLSLNRPAGPGGSDWRGYSLALLPAMGGSSGSLVLHEDEVIGILIGSFSTQGSSFTVLVPLSRFPTFFSSDTAARDVTY